MGRLEAFLRFSITVVVCWFVVGTAALYVGLGLVSVLGYPLAWSVYGFGCLIAIALAVSAPRIVAALPAPRWLSRTAVACSAVFVCLELAVAATPDWSPVPLLASLLVGSACAVIAWTRTTQTAVDPQAVTV